jgi:hypothetical protein
MWEDLRYDSMTWLSRRFPFMVVCLHGVVGRPLLPWRSLIEHYVQLIGKGYSLTVYYRALLRKTLIIVL